MDNTIVAAAVGAVVATGVTLLVNQVQKQLYTQAYQADVNNAHASGREIGYREGYDRATAENTMPTRKLSSVS